MSFARPARLDEVMKRRYVEGGYLPGMLTDIYRKGHLVHTGICGRIDIERDRPMREDAIFRIYSIALCGGLAEAAASFTVRAAFCYRRASGEGTPSWRRMASS